MATFYQGTRPVLKGRDADESIHPYKGVGVYSNWALFNTSHVLDGAPDTDHTPGTGYHPHGLQLTRRFRGLETHGTSVEQLRSPGGGVRLGSHFRWHPNENKAAGNNLVFKAGFGHIVRTVDYSLNDYYDDTYRQRRLDDAGHAIRYTGDAGVVEGMGAYRPFVNQGVTAQPLSDTTQEYPEGSDYGTVYGRNRVGEWVGVPSGKALNV